MRHASSLASAAASTSCSVAPPGNSATVRPPPQHDDAVAQAEQFRHFARRDQHAEALAPRARGCARRSRPWRRRRRRASARRAAAAAARRAPPWRTRPSAGCRPRARRPRARAAAGARRRRLIASRASAVSRARDMRNIGDTRFSTDSTTLRPTRVAQHQPAAAPVVGDEAEARARARRGSRPESRGRAGDLDRPATICRRRPRHRARSAIRCAPRP